MPTRSRAATTSAPPHHISRVRRDRRPPARAAGGCSRGHPRLPRRDQGRREGRVYASSFRGVQVFDPDGDLIGEINLPGAVNFAFGGTGRNVLFITTDTAVWAAVLTRKERDRHGLGTHTEDHRRRGRRRGCSTPPSSTRPSRATASWSPSSTLAASSSSSGARKARRSPARGWRSTRRAPRRSSSDPSREIEEQVSSGRLGALALHGARALTGGIPLIVDGEVVGAIGTSGETPDEDESISIAGAAADFSTVDVPALTYEARAGWPRPSRPRRAGAASRRSCAVVDAGGELVYLWRPDAAQVASVEVSIDKARTAAIYRRPSKDFEDQASGGRPSALHLARAVPLQGGMPIVHDGEVIGAIGVSGASSADEDQELAEIGAAAAERAAAVEQRREGRGREHGRDRIRSTLAARPGPPELLPAGPTRSSTSRPTRASSLVGGAVALLRRDGRGDRLRRARLTRGPARARAAPRTAPTTCCLTPRPRTTTTRAGASSRRATRGCVSATGASASTGTASTSRSPSASATSTPPARPSSSRS